MESRSLDVGGKCLRFGKCTGLLQVIVKWKTKYCPQGFVILNILQSEFVYEIVGLVVCN